MSKQEEFKQFDDYEYDELFKDNENVHIDDNIYNIKNRKYWSLIYREPNNDDPLENINRIRFMVDNYDCQIEELHIDFANAMKNVLKKTFEQVKNMQKKINTIENMFFDDKNFEKEYNAKRKQGWNESAISYDIEKKESSDNPLENLHRIRFMQTYGGRDMDYIPGDTESVMFYLLNKSIEKLEELTKK